VASRASVLLIPGVDAEASSWRMVVPRLREAGHSVVALRLPLTSVAEEVAMTRQAIDGLERPLVVAAHSWGGVVMTEAVINPELGRWTARRMRATIREVADASHALVLSHPSEGAGAILAAVEASTQSRTVAGRPDRPLPALGEARVGRCRRHPVAAHLGPAAGSRVPAPRARPGPGGVDA
jgi:alpha-beta hydrolase superfamily lysophospholipase